MPWSSVPPRAGGWQAVRLQAPPESRACRPVGISRSILRLPGVVIPGIPGQSRRGMRDGRIRPLWRVRENRVRLTVPTPSHCAGTARLSRKDCAPEDCSSPMMMEEERELNAMDPYSLTGLACRLSACARGPLLLMALFPLGASAVGAQRSSDLPANQFLEMRGVGIPDAHSPLLLRTGVFGGPSAELHLSIAEPARPATARPPFRAGPRYAVTPAPRSASWRSPARAAVSALPATLGAWSR
jgi:hypothetical protein